MTFYSDKAALADRLLLKYGFTATVRGAATVADPVTGLGGSDGATRSVQAVFTRIDFRTFPETLVRKGDRMVIFGGPVSVGEVLVESGDWQIREVQNIKPDGSTHIITKALVSG